MSDFLQTVNWRTTLYAVAYVGCRILGGIYVSMESVCQVLETLIVAGGFVSAADSERVQSIVRAVDVLAFKNKIDPAALVPLDDGTITKASLLSKALVPVLVAVFLLGGVACGKTETPASPTTVIELPRIQNEQPVDRRHEESDRRER